MEPIQPPARSMACRRCPFRSARRASSRPKPSRRSWTTTSRRSWQRTRTPSGLFESQMAAISELVHSKGGLVYGDGANLNALMGKARPGDLGNRRHAVQSAQDLHDPAWRRRPRLRSGRIQGAPRSLRTRPGRRTAGRAFRRSTTTAVRPPSVGCALFKATSA